MSTHGPTDPPTGRPDGDAPDSPPSVEAGDRRSGGPEPGGATPAAAHGGRAPAKKGSLLRELPVLLVIAFVLALLVKTFLVQAFFIPSGSMEQTLHGCPGCTGDRVLVNKVPYWFGEPEPGDVVVFRGPDTWSPEITVEEPSNWFTGALLTLGRAIGVAPPSEDDYVKRVIATEGQEVACCDAEGRVTVDGEPLDEPYIYQDNPIESRAFSPVVVPEGRLWVMGDHRSASADSVEHSGDEYSGTIGVDDVIGKAAVIVWPLDRLGFIDDPEIQADAAAAPAGLPVQGGAAVAVPYVLGLVGAVPLTAWRRRRRLRPLRAAGPSRRPPRTGWRRVRRPAQTRPARDSAAG
ncbi:signal peptidase I [Modestobacter roseus]|uniref:Signal peptidase I n=1 Tax=Modestobacter roseus TaxID=1181884 RepID=A0A562IS63_9ACTN|nr:signal peptidase I [Modestobacter roseus]MQA35506.1 signal peptidase I [Modestobacter roseus]TWH73879.1 signal peptidase I [Modestobacter roseus]